MHLVTFHLLTACLAVLRKMFCYRFGCQNTQKHSWLGNSRPNPVIFTHIICANGKLYLKPYLVILGTQVYNYYVAAEKRLQEQIDLWETLTDSACSVLLGVSSGLRCEITCHITTVSGWNHYQLSVVLCTYRTTKKLQGSNFWMYHSLEVIRFWLPDRAENYSWLVTRRGIQISRHWTFRDSARVNIR